ncbi:hypothetical protein HDU96_005208 [Phlyctochytrium bullatum]|nr:hypothetical protein HDU96_005208 [Phlyctochytrium bullatum]
MAARLEVCKIKAVDLAKDLVSNWKTKYKGKRRLGSEDFGNLTTCRVAIHIPSISAPQEVRKQCLNVRMQQLQQIGRLTELHDPNVIVILVYLPMEEELETLFKSAFCSSFNPHELINQQRFWMVFPESHAAFSNHASISSMLLASEKAIRQIKDLIEDLPAYIVPGVVGDEEMFLSAKLNVPIMSSFTMSMPLVMSRSAQRKFLQDTQVQMAPGYEFLSNEEEILLAIRNVMTQCKQCQRVILKIDGEIDGRGVAYFDIKKFTKKWADRRHWRPLLIANMMLHARLVRPDIHGNFQRFFLLMIEKGGVVESAPPVMTYDVKEAGDAILDADLLGGPPSRNPSVFLFIEPDGTVLIKGSADKLSTTPYNFWGILTPHQSCEAEDLFEAAENVGRLCAVLWDDLTHESRNIWVVGLKPYYTEPLALYQLFCLTVGEITPQPSRSRLSRRDNPGRILFDANKARRVRLHFLDRVRWVDMERIRQAVGPSGIEGDENGETEQDWQERCGVVSMRFFHPGMKYMSCYAMQGICNDTGSVFDFKWKFGTLYLSGIQYRKTMLPFMFSSRTGMDAIELTLTLMIIVYRRLLTTYLDEGNNFMVSLPTTPSPNEEIQAITKALVPELIQGRLRASLKRLMKPPQGEPELFELTWQRHHEESMMPVKIEISHAEILEARRRVLLPKKRTSLRHEDIRGPGPRSLLPARGTDLLKPKLDAVSGSTSFTSLPDIVVSGAVTEVEEEYVIPEEFPDADDDDELAKGHDGNPARYSPMELLLRRVMKLPDFGALGLNSFNPNQFQQEVRRLQMRRGAGDSNLAGGKLTRSLTSIKASLETSRILSQPIPSLVLSKLDPMFNHIEPLTGPVFPEHLNDPTRVPIGLPVYDYLDIMERRAAAEDERIRLEKIRKEEEERRKKEEEERTRKRLEERRRQLEEEEERMKFEEEMRKATEGKTLIEKVAIEREMLKQRDEERRKKIEIEIRIEEERIRSGVMMDDNGNETLALETRKKKLKSKLRQFMDMNRAQSAGRRSHLDLTSRTDLSLSVNEGSDDARLSSEFLAKKSRQVSFPMASLSQSNKSSAKAPKPIMTVFRQLREELNIAKDFSQ